MRKLILPLLCLALLLCACSEAQTEIKHDTKVWPTHAPEATPYVRQQEETPTEPTENEEYESYEELLRSLYSQEGKFFFKEEELKMFRELPQNESYSFVIHLEPMWSSDARLLNNDGALKLNSEEYYRLQEEVQLEYCMKAAQVFADKGCEAVVRSMKGVEHGVEYNDYITIISATPEHLFEISGEMENLFYVEQLFSSVDDRFDETVWSSEG